MENIKEVMWGIRYLVVVAILGSGYVAFSWKTLKINVLTLIAKAEVKAEELALASGEAQENYVVEILKNILPARIKLFLNDTMLHSIVRYIYCKSIDLLDDGKINNSEDETLVKAKEDAELAKKQALESVNNALNEAKKALETVQA